MFFYLPFWIFLGESNHFSNQFYRERLQGIHVEREKNRFILVSNFWVPSFSITKTFIFIHYKEHYVQKFKFRP